MFSNITRFHNYELDIILGEKQSKVTSHLATKSIIKYIKKQLYTLYWWVAIAAQSTATFSRSIVLPRI